jgi:hypothetical protein
MASTTSELQSIARELNKVRSAAQARGAIRAVLRAISGGYETLDHAYVASDEEILKRKNELTQRRVWLEEWYKSILHIPDTWDFTEEWTKHRHFIDQGYNAVAAAEGVANYVPSTSNWQILKTSLLEAPGVFTKAVVTVAKETAVVAGDVVGSAAGGILSGLGLFPALLVAAGVVLYLKGGNPIALVTGLLGKKA